MHISNRGPHLQARGKGSDAALQILCDLNDMGIIILFNKIEK